MDQKDEVKTESNDLDKAQSDENINKECSIHSIISKAVMDCSKFVNAIMVVNVATSNGPDYVDYIDCNKWSVDFALSIRKDLILPMPSFY